MNILKRAANRLAQWLLPDSRKQPISPPTPPVALDAVDDNFIEGQVHLILEGVIHVDQAEATVDEEHKRIAKSFIETTITETKDLIHRLEEKIKTLQKNAYSSRNRRKTDKAAHFMGLFKPANILAVLLLIVILWGSLTGTATKIQDYKMTQGSLNASVASPQSLFSSEIIPVALVTFLLSMIYQMLHHSSKPVLATLFLFLLAIALVFCLTLVLTVTSIESLLPGGQESMEKLGAMIADKYSLASPLDLRSDSIPLTWTRILLGILMGSTASIGLISLNFNGPGNSNLVEQTNTPGKSNTKGSGPSKKRTAPTHNTETEGILRLQVELQILQKKQQDYIDDVARFQQEVADLAIRRLHKILAECRYSLSGHAISKPGP